MEHSHQVTKGRQSRRKEKMVIFLTLASPTMVLKNVVLDFTAVGQFRKANDLPKMLEDKRRSSPSAGGGGVRSVLPVPCS